MKILILYQTKLQSMRHIFTLLLFGIIITSCKNIDTLKEQIQKITIKNTKETPAQEVTTDEEHIVYEKFKSGKVKSIIEAKGKLRHGVTKNYDQVGNLVSTLTYKDNQLDGLATNYYKNGAVHSTIEYKNNQKNGQEIWYYENGKKYRVNHFLNGKLNGVQQKFYNNGRLMSEVPYKNNQPGKGTKEYSEDGKLIAMTAKIAVNEIDQVPMTGKLILQLYLTNRSGNVEFYVDDLDEGKYLPEYTYSLPVENGIAIKDYYIPRGTALMKKITIIAKYTSKMRNPYIITRSYNVAAKN